MVRLSTIMVTLPNGNRIALRGGRPSVRVLVQLLIGRGYSVEVRLFPNNILLSVPAADRPFLLIFRGALLTVREREVAPVVPSCVIKSDDSSTSAFGCSNNDSDAIDPDLPELGRRHWLISGFSPSARVFPYATAAWTSALPPPRPLRPWGIRPSIALIAPPPSCVRRAPLPSARWAPSPVLLLGPGG